MASQKYLLVVLLVLLLALPSFTEAFGAGNIASIARIEGHNWRHGDIEDMLKTVTCLKHHKWTSMMIKRVYFGNWLRDYSQAVDVGTLKGVQADTIRVLVWVLAFMSFGYATAEFEVTSERLGVYRPEEHIDNPKDYADNVDARQYDQRLRGPVSHQELEIDPQSGMKNYIANERGGWATSAGYIRYSFSRSIHYGRMYTHGANKHREEDLCEALRCLGQGLHCLEDFGAHTNYTELVLRELGFHNVFAHVGSGTQINLRGKQVYPLVTGTFGGVDFLHSVLGEASDHVTQTEVEEMNDALGGASAQSKRGGGDAQSGVAGLTSLLSKVPGTGSLCQEAVSLQQASDAQAAANSGGGGGFARDREYGDDFSSERAWNPLQSFSGPPGSQGGPPGPGIPGLTNMNTDPKEVIKKIYPILEFRDKVVRAISSIISKIPGLEKLIDTITERVTLFVMGLLAPYIQPLIATATQGLQQGSGTVINASANQQYLVFEDPHSSDPTHSMLSKDHFSNILNEPAGQVAAVVLQYVAPRIIYAWDHPDVQEQEVLDDVLRVFHHPAVRDRNCEIHRSMYGVVEKWVQSRPDRGRNLDDLLSTQSVRAGRNHKGGVNPHGGHGVSSSGPMAMFGQKGDIHGATASPMPTYRPSQQAQFAPPVDYNPSPPPPQAQSSPYGGPPAYDPRTDPYGRTQSFQNEPQQSFQAEPQQGFQPEYQHGPPPAAFAPNDSFAYPSAYQQGYEMPYQSGPPPFQGQPQYGQPQGPPQGPPHGPPHGQPGYPGYSPGPPHGQPGYPGYQPQGPPGGYGQGYERY